MADEKFTCLKEGMQIKCRASRLGGMSILAIINCFTKDWFILPSVYVSRSLVTS